MSLENLDFLSLKKSKNLLAFSAGIDSSALFFLLLQQNIDFDIAIVNYNLREQAKDEVLYAKELANKFHKTIYIKETTLEGSNFEKRARDIRYAFFDDIIKEHSYDTLLTAHQLNDKLEWFMMQLSNGAGFVELLGLKEHEKRKDYCIFKPLLQITKDELENFLIKNKIKYFIDDSNYDEKYKRNYFRHNFTDKFLDEFKDGIKNSFEYLEKDLDSLGINNKAYIHLQDLELFKTNPDDNVNIRMIDKSLKKRGYLLSKAQRIEILKQKALVVSHNISISINDDFIWIAPISDIVIDKKYKEIYRINKIPKNIRAYIYEKSINIKDLMI
jgi:tRNA(Ile)-lysidine synthase